MRSALAAPRDLTIPEPGGTAAREVLSRAIGRLLGELPVVGRGLGLSAEARADLRGFERWARLALARSPGALASALRRPTVGALVRCVRPGRLGGARAEAALTELFATVYLELAAAGAMPEGAEMRRAPGRIFLGGARAVVELPGDTRGLGFANGRVTAERPGGKAELRLEALEGEEREERGEAGEEREGGIRIARPYHAVEGGIALALADNNPVALEEAHPDKSGNAIDLGGQSAEAWAAALRGALGPIGRYLPELRREMELFVHLIVPVGYDEARHLSASYQEAIGTIYMTLHPSVMTMAEALIHEFSHNKINALFELDEVLENAFSPLYTSPVRPDPRPLHGVLLAVHAFLPVARLYERMIEQGDPLAQNAAFSRRFEQIKAINGEGAEVLLAHGRPTRVGRGVLDEIRRWSDYYDKGAQRHD